MIKCQTCGTENLDGSQFCDECGQNLQSSGNNNNEFKVQSYQAPLSEPSFNVASVTSIGIEPIIEQVEPTPVENGAAKKIEGVHSTLTIERGVSVGKQFTLTAEESYIGRWDADNWIFPDIDLDAHDPEALMKLWFPGGLQGLGQMQERLWRQFMGSLAPDSSGRGKSKEPR